MGKYIFCMLLLFPLWMISCHKEAEQETGFVTVNAEFTDHMELRMSEFIESITFTPLETDPYYLVSMIRKVECTPDRYYVGTTRMGNSMDKIIIFDKAGQYLHQVMRIGEGPDEFPYISDFCITHEGNLLITTRFKQMTLDPDGQEVLAVEPTATYGDRITQTQSKRYFYTRGNTQRYAQDQSIDEFLTCIDLKTSEKEHFFKPASLSAYHQIRGTSLSNDFSVYNERVYFSLPYCDTIFDITKNRLEPAFYLDYGKKKRPEGLFEWDDEGNRKANIKGYEGLWNTWSFHVGSDYLFFRFGTYYAREFYIALFNTYTNKTLIGNVLVDDLYFIGTKLKFSMDCLSLVGQVEDKKLLWTIEPASLLGIYEAHREKLSAAEWQAFKRKHAVLVTLCENMKEDDNPVLLTIKLK